MEVATLAPKGFRGVGFGVQGLGLDPFWAGSTKYIFPKIRGTFLGVPKIRIVVFWGLYWVPFILGNYRTYVYMYIQLHGPLGNIRFKRLGLSKYGGPPFEVIVLRACCFEVHLQRKSPMHVTVEEVRRSAHPVIVV